MSKTLCVQKEIQVIRACGYSKVSGDNLKHVQVYLVDSSIYRIHEYSNYFIDLHIVGFRRFEFGQI